jgi:broad specificity phosphatase PhoE
MKEIYLIRHGETMYNVEKRVQGKGVDSSLNEKGGLQAKAFYDFYKDHGFELVITSSLNRTKETVADFIHQNKIKHLEYDYLDEISWGIYEGKQASEELYRDHKNILTEWSKAKYDSRIEGGESAAEMKERLSIFLNILPTFAENKILICTHGATLAFLMTILQNQALSLMPSYKHNNTGLCKFLFDGTSYSLQLQDDLKHLELLIL